MNSPNERCPRSGTLVAGRAESLVTCPACEHPLRLASAPAGVVSGWAALPEHRRMNRTPKAVGWADDVRVLLTPLRMREAAPIASGTRPAFVDGTDEKGEHFGGVADLPFVSYAPTPEGFLIRRLRQALGLHLGEAGRALGIGTVEMSWLERGKYLLDGEAFRKACERLCAAAKAKRKGR